MAWKSILVHLDATPASGRRAEAAAHLAARLDAHLTGLYAINGADIPHRGGRERREALAEFAADAEAEFRRCGEERGVVAAWRQAVGTEPVQVNNDVITIARHHDVCVLGQKDAERDDPAVPDDLIDQVVSRAGRPVLVIPFAGHHTEIARRPVVAWNASREAARALADALPLLELAGKVTVLRLASTGRQRPMVESPLSDLTGYLATHGVEAVNDHLTVDRAEIEVPEAFLSYLAQEAFDLLVMGSTGEIRPRAGKSLVRPILGRVAVPVLLSH